MRVGLVSLAYNEARFLKPFLNHIPEWVDEKLVLITAKPWFGEHLEDDGSGKVAQNAGATVLKYPWDNEEEQRNTGQDYFNNCDWVITLDPDEFLSDDNWDILREYLEFTSSDAAVVEKQRVFWKNKEVSPCNDYQQLIVSKPHIRFIDKRVVNTAYDVAPVELLHFSWARTDDEVYKKITHYAHANDFDTQAWFKDVWLADKQEDLHPTTPESLKALVDAHLPPEISKLGLFPK